MLVLAVAWAKGAEEPSVVLTNTLQLRELTARKHVIACSFQLDGVILWASPERDQIILQDDTGGVRLEMDFQNWPSLKIGQKVLVKGRALAGAGRVREILIDNDGMHGTSELSGRIYLQAGKHPIRVDWFNGQTHFELKVEYEGPTLSRRTIPDAVLSDLNFHAYEGVWDHLPKFQTLPAVRTGTSKNFDLTARSRDEHVGLQFTGFIDIPQDGLYTFWISSDDGSRLIIDRSAIEVKAFDEVRLPKPGPIEPGQPLTESDEFRWSLVEGAIISLQPQPGGGWLLDLISGTNRMVLDVLQDGGGPPHIFSRIRARGICRGASTISGKAIASRLMVPDLSYIEEMSSRMTSPFAQAMVTGNQMRQLARAGGHMVSPLRIEGVVLAASHGGGVLALQIDSDAALLQTDLAKKSLQPGMRIALEGNFVWEGDRWIVHTAPLVDNDGMHGQIEKSGKVFLRAGKHPIHLSWFNLGEPGALTLFFEGPDLPRQRIPDQSLFLLEREASGTVKWAQGLHYKCYEGSWTRVPNFGWMDPVRAGRTTNFNSSIATRSAHAGLEFDGFIEVPNEGIYTFGSVSDDGCLLYLGNQATRLEITGTNVPPEPVVLSVLQPLTDEQRHRWAEIEGQVTFVSRQGEGLNLELSVGTGRVRVEVADGSEGSPRLLRNSKVRARGISQSAYTADGQRVAGSLITPSINQVEILELAPSLWAECPIVPISELWRSNFAENAGAIAHVRGKIQIGGAEEPMLVVDETGQVPIALAQGMKPHNGEQVEALGRRQGSETNLMLQRVCWRPVLIGAADNRKGLPLLTTIEQVKGLSRQEAQRGYPVRVRGIITTPLSGGFFIQDVAWAIYVRTPAEVQADLPRAGDYWEVEGDTFAEFAPNILARRTARLGAGLLPEPLHPTWDQLINGSLDTRYVEIQGVVTAVDADGMALLTRAGILKVELSDVDSRSLKKYENSLIRVRGCVIPARDNTTQRVELGHIWLSNSSINIDEAAPADPFAAPLKRVADLLFFDPRAGAIQRVKVAGQITHERHGEYFLLEGTNGARFIPRAHGHLNPGDRVEVVGFPDLAGPSPLLREAVVRQTGTAPLPEPELLTEPWIPSRSHDARLVQVKARLMNFSLNRLDQILEMQSGARGFVARLETSRGAVRDLIPGSRLELTGTYAGQGGDLTAGRDVNSFELLLNSAAAIKVLERPPWWNLQHTLMVVGGLSLLILAALVWIVSLRRQVEERSRQLTSAIQRQEGIERQHALERERSRIAQDLHDDLGATLTQIRLLSALESRDLLVPIPNRSRMSQVTEKARQMVASLDEIVWAVNPANDSLISLATYCCHFAEEFFRPTGIRCRLDVSDNLPQLPLTSEVRHNLYLAIKEALNNVVKHSRATEVWLRVLWQEDGLRIILEDNGCGFTSRTETNEMNTGDGLVNIRRRLEMIGGNFETESQPGIGTTSRIWLPLGRNGNGCNEVNDFETHAQHQANAGTGVQGSERKKL